MQKKYRLTSSRSFDYAYKHGESYVDRYLVLYVLKSKYPTPKVGFSVGKKVGCSVVRNRTKRRLREAFRREFARVEKGYNYVVVARTASAERTYDELRRSLLSLLESAGKLAAKTVES